MPRSLYCLLIAAFVYAAPVQAQEKAAPAKGDKVGNVDELLQKVRLGADVLSREAQQREAQFLAAKSEQQAMLDAIREKEQQLIAQSARLEGAFEAGEKKAAELELLLQKRMGGSGELFGLVRQVSGDTRGQLSGSLVSAQYPGRAKDLEPLTKAKSLPTLEQLERLWFLLHQELTESGKVRRFEANVVDAAGEQQKASVTRVGAFNVVAEGEYLTWNGQDQRLTRLPRQPATRYLASAAALEAAGGGETPLFAVDPSRGSVLSMLVQTPTVEERLELGGIVGYAILGLGAVAFVLALLRLVYLAFVRTLVARQERTPETPSKRNPLGRVLAVYTENRETQVDTLERKLDEAIVRESSRVERLLWLIKVVSVVAPLMGLLGTVTGMIQTFQAITLFGTGDPKLMAGGISEALVTTMLGLVVAIPLLLLHSGISTLARRIVDILNEQAAGMIAKEAEQAAP